MNREQIFSEEEYSGIVNQASVDLWPLTKVNMYDREKNAQFREFGFMDFELI